METASTSPPGGASAAAGSSSPDKPKPFPTLDRAFQVNKSEFHLPAAYKEKKPSLRKRCYKQIKHLVCLISCNYWWACCCCRQLQLEVRGLLLLTTIETVAGFAYGSNLLATAVTSDEDVDPAVYYIATFIVCISCMMWVFVYSSIKRENVYELVAANLLSFMLCLTPTLLVAMPSDKLDMEVENITTTTVDGEESTTEALVSEESSRLCWSTRQVTTTKKGPKPPKARTSPTTTSTATKAAAKPPREAVIGVGVGDGVEMAA